MCLHSPFLIFPIAYAKGCAIKVNKIIIFQTLRPLSSFYTHVILSDNLLNLDISWYTLKFFSLFPTGNSLDLSCEHLSQRWFAWNIKLYEPAHDKTYNKTCAASKDSDQHVHPRCLIRVFADHMCPLQLPGYPKKDKQEPLPYCMDVQVDLSLCWLIRSYCSICHAPAYMPLRKISLLGYYMVY